MLVSTLNNIMMAPARGLLSLFEEITDRVENELYDTENIQRQLLELRMQYELEEISEEDFAAQEAVLLERLRKAKEREEEERREEG